MLHDNILNKSNHPNFTGTKTTPERGTITPRCTYRHHILYSTQKLLKYFSSPFKTEQISLIVLHVPLANGNQPQPHSKATFSTEDANEQLGTKGSSGATPGTQECHQERPRWLSSSRQSFSDQTSSERTGNPQQRRQSEL